MNKTELLYYAHPEMKSFTAHITEVEKTDSGFQVVLDKTCFYPEGGGQPCDTGTIDGLPVHHVRKEDGLVYHLMKDRPNKENVTGEINWVRRFDYMQQHSGQHILSGILYRNMGYNTVSVHMGEDYTSIEINIEDISEEELITLEDQANNLICRNMLIEKTWTTDDNLESFSLRRKTAVIGDVRVVSLGDFDSVACGGVHCTSTGEVGLIKVIGMERIRGRVRLLFKIGSRARDDYRLKTQITDQLNAMFSSRLGEIADRAASLLEENTSLRLTIGALKKEMASDESNRMYKNTSPDEDGIRRVSGTFTGYTNQDVIEMVKHLIEKADIQVCIVLKNDNSLFWCIGCSENLSFPFNNCRNELLETINGKGGGKEPLWQGMGRNPEGVERFIEVWYRNTGQLS